MIRSATEEDILTIAEIWHVGWHDGHAAHAPQELTALRTLKDFQRRVHKDLSGFRVLVCDGTIEGFVLLGGDEIVQFYVRPQARGTGLAAQLIEDSERVLHHAGHAVGFLFVHPDNARAIRFYEKAGWRRVGLEVANLETSEGPMPLEVLRMDKAL